MSFKTVHIVESDGFPVSAFACRKASHLMVASNYATTFELRNAIAARATQGGLYHLCDEYKAMIVEFCKRVSAGNLCEYHTLDFPCLRSSGKKYNHVTVYIRDCSTSHPFELVQYAL